MAKPFWEITSYPERRQGVDGTVVMTGLDHHLRFFCKCGF
jgi:hypothetical protein